LRGIFFFLISKRILLKNAKRNQVYKGVYKRGILTIGW